jgi:2,3-bisphosphoglycerate-independent phosphoglycerate mutase
MKYVIFLGDGMADYPIPELNGKTPLMVAKKPAMDRIAREGRTGLFRTIDPDMMTGSAIANLSVLGYNATELFHGTEGRGVLEAASLGIELDANDMAMRVNLICIEDGKIRSHSAGHITTEEARILINDIQEYFKVGCTGISPNSTYLLPFGNKAPLGAPASRRQQLRENPRFYQSNPNVDNKSAVSDKLGRRDGGAPRTPLGKKYAALGSSLRIYPGLSYRHVLVVPGGEFRLVCFPPHDHVGTPWKELLVKPMTSEGRETADLLNRMIEESQKFLEQHPVNQRRRAEGKQPANSLWPWAPGKKPVMKTLQQRFGISGAAITAVDLIKGLAIYAGMQPISIEGATGLYDTNYEGKADAALKALEDVDFVYIHVEAPDEAGHEKNLQLKIRCIEDLDRRLIQRVLEGLEKKGWDTTVALLPDHPTPIAQGNHTREPVPVAIRCSKLQADSVSAYDEESVKQGALGLLSGAQFIETFFST